MASIADYQNLILADSPLLYWPLNDGGSTTDDLSGNAYHGTINGGAWLNPPIATRRGDYAFGYAASTADAVTYTGTLDTLNATGLSVEFWLRIGTSISGTTRPYIHGLAGFSEFGFYGTTTSTAVVGTHATSRFTLAANSIVLNTWAHWVYTQDSAGSSNVYKDGTLLAGPATHTRPATDMTGLRIDNNSSSARIDYWQHVAVYDKVLTATDVSDRYDLAMDQSILIVEDVPALFIREAIVIPPVGGGGSGPVVDQPHQKWPTGI